MFKYSVGYNGQQGFEEAIEPYLEYIADVYFAPPYTPSGRVQKGGAVSLDYPVNLDKFLNWARERGLETNLLLNALCTGGEYASNERMAKVQKIVEFYGERYGVKLVTVVSPFDGEVIKRKFPEVKIHSSVNMFIRNAVQAKEVEHFTDVYVLDRNVNRDLEAIRSIKEEVGKPIRLLANEGCVLECMNRVQHFNQISHIDPPIGVRYLLCISKYINDKATVLKAPIIRPEDVHHYEGLVDSMKLATRNQGNDQVKLIVDAYVRQSYDGNLFDLLESNGLIGYLEYCAKQAQGSTMGMPYLDNKAIPDDFFEKVSTCNKLCHKCGYCNKVAERAFQFTSVAPNVIFTNR